MERGEGLQGAIQLPRLFAWRHFQRSTCYSATAGYSAATLKNRYQQVLSYVCQLPSSHTDYRHKEISRLADPRGPHRLTSSQAAHLQIRKQHRFMKQEEYSFGRRFPNEDETKPLHRMRCREIPNTQSTNSHRTPRPWLGRRKQTRRTRQDNDNPQSGCIATVVV